MYMNVDGYVFYFFDEYISWKFFWLTSYVFITHQSSNTFIEKIFFFDFEIVA